MGFSYRKRIKTGKNSWLNVSNRGVSGSFRLGPFTVNTRGGFSVRLANGLSYRKRGRSGGCAVVLLVPVATLAAVAAFVVR